MCIAVCVRAVIATVLMYNGRCRVLMIYRPSPSLVRVHSVVCVVYIAAGILYAHTQHIQHTCIQHTAQYATLSSVWPTQ